MEHGVGWATASARKYARIWARIFHYFDSGMPDLAWMPAHTAVHDVGVLRLSNGDSLTQLDRFGNGEADKWAKAAARGDRVPREIRDSIIGMGELVTDTARWIGQATAAAQQFTLDNG